MELSDRSRQILFALVTEYISTGKAVSSRTIARRYGIGLSAATIRNVLADLVDAGFVHQPHTSAGRVPTDLGFRRFVDAMVVSEDVSEAHRTAVMSRLRSLGPGADLMRETGQLLSGLTESATVITTAKTAEAVLDQARFMPLRGGQILAVLVRSSGAVENRVIRSVEAINPTDLERVNNYLDELVSGRTLQEVRRLLATRVATERGQYELLRRQAEAMVEAAVEGSEPGPLVIEGQEQLFERPEFIDTDKIRGYLRALEDKQRLLELLDQTVEADGVRVLIGAETRLNVEDISLISSTYSRDGTSMGSLGIVGPTRMDYLRFVPLVGYTAEILGKLLAERTLKGRSEQE